MSETEAVQRVGAEGYELLREAVRRAQGHGACSYKVGCVIAQLADLADPTGETRHRLNAFSPRDEGASIGSETATGAWAVSPALHAFPKELLCKLQCEWDRLVLTTPDTRDAMFAIISNHERANGEA